MPIQHIKHILINALLLAALTPLPVWSGELHDFEHDVTKSDENKPHPNRNTHARRSSQESEPPSQTAEDDSDCDGLFSCFLELILSDAVNAIVSGIGKAATSNSGALQKPDVKFSLMTQKVAPDIVGTRYKFALDYATASLYGEATQYKEDDPKDSLQLMNAMFMQRIPLSRRLRSGLGLGIYNLLGESSTYGAALSIPLNYRVSGRLSIESTATLININDNVVGDMDFAARYELKPMDLIIGYRSLNSQNEQLQGPYAGISVNF